MKLTKTLATILTTLGTVLSLGAVACADNVITVKTGDTLSSIANENSTTVSQLQSINNIRNLNEIKVGQKIIVNPSNFKNNYVIVKDGDTLSKIAFENETTVEKLQELNHLPNINKILPGQKILLNSNPNLITNSVQAVQAQSQLTNKTTNSPVSNLTNQNTDSMRKNTQSQKQLNDQQPQQSQSKQSDAVNNNSNSASQNDTNYQNTTSSTSSNKVTLVNSSNTDSNNLAAKNWIAQHESGGNYNATNGQYIGKYQLSSSYLHGDYSPANQEKCADQYVNNRYGNWVNAQQHWMTYGWY